MTDTPKVRFNNSILADPDNIAFKKDKKDAKADANSAPETSKVEEEKNAKAADEKKAAEDKKDAKKADDAEKAPAPKPAAEAEKTTETPPKAEKEEAAKEAPPKAALMYKNDSIGEPGYDYSVYNFTNDNISGFRDGNTADTAYPYNGWERSPPSQPSLMQRNRKDISDKDIDEEVYGFVRADKNMSPIPTIARRTTAYPYNGWDNTPPSQPSLMQRNKKDISDKDIDEEVYGFVRADKNMSPLPTIARRTSAYPNNGWDMTPPSSPSLSQRNRKDISDKDIDEEVYGFVRADKNMSPIPTIARRTTAYPYNGWDNTPPSQPSLMQKKNISQPGVEPNVYDFVHDKVEVLNWPRNDAAYPPNGWDRTDALA